MKIYVNKHGVEFISVNKAFKWLMPDVKTDVADIKLQILDNWHNKGANGFNFYVKRGEGHPPLLKLWQCCNLKLGFPDDSREINELVSTLTEINRNKIRKC